MGYSRSSPSWKPGIPGFSRCLEHTSMICHQIQSSKSETTDLLSRLRLFPLLSLLPSYSPPPLCVYVSVAVLAPGASPTPGCNHLISSPTRTPVFSPLSVPSPHWFTLWDDLKTPSSENYCVWLS